MDTIHLYLAFILATAVLILIPGPNVALIVANSIAHGARFGLLTVAGTSSAMVLQLGLTALGTTALMEALANWFEWIRWIGVAYLVYLGIRTWRAPAVDLSATRAQPKSVRTMFLRGFLVSLTNPKTLFFYGAFFPQFMPNADPPQRPGVPLWLLAVTFLILAIVLDSVWAITAGKARSLLSGSGSRARLRNRITGGLLIGAGLGLALARRK